MPNFKRNLRQTCTYWAKTGTDQYNKPTFGTPVTLACRWEDTSEKVIDKHGAEIVSKSRVFTAVEFSAEGYLALGDHTGTPSPLGLDSADEIRQMKRVPDLRNLQTLYTTWL